jgi:hypothetical protein
MGFNAIQSGRQGPTCHEDLKSHIVIDCGELLYSDQREIMCHISEVCDLGLC